MSELILKLKMLLLCRGYFKDWYKEVWKQDGNRLMCCDGYMCGCQGSYYSDMWEHLWKTRKSKS